MATTINTVGNTVARLWQRGLVGVIGMILAVLACYGVLALTALLPLLGIRLVLDATVWAGAIVALALATVVAVLPGFRCHRNAVPGLAALAAGGLILHALLVEYRALVELAGFVLLAGAVFSDALLRRRTRTGLAPASPAWQRARHDGR